MKYLNVVFALLVAGSAAAQQPINQSIPSAAGGTVQVSNVAGRVTVTAWNRPEISVTGTLGRGSERLAVEGSGSNTRISVIIPDNARNVQGSELEVHVPAGKDVTVHTTSADIDIEGVTGSVTGRSTSGNVKISGNPGAVTATSTSGDVDVGVSSSQIRANTTSGDVRVAGSARQSVSAQTVSGDVGVSATTPELTAKSVSGDLTVSGVSGRMTASTVSGTATIRAGRIQYGSFESVSGSLHFQGDLQPDATFNIKSHSGDVELSLPSGIAAEFQVNTFSGDVVNQFGVAASRTAAHGPGRTLNFTTGNGGPLVTVKTFSGSVELLKR